MAGDRKKGAESGAWICFADEAGSSLTGAVTHTWAMVAETPTLTVVKGKQTKLSMTSVCCYKPGHTPKMLYATVGGWYHDRQLMEFLDHVHQILSAPLIVVWDNLAAHHSAWTQRAIAGRDWLSVEYLPSYAPDLNPAENVWSVLKRTDLANLAALTFDELATTARRGLRAVQRRPSLLTGFLAHAGLVLHSQSSIQ